MNQRFADTIVVLDFETTGLSPDNGDRAIEIGAVRIVEGKITEQFQALMNPGVRVNSFIEQYTGITNGMLDSAASCNEVMAEFCDFIADDNLLAHNASFDQKFLDNELAQISRSYEGEFTCSLLVSRRINLDAPSHSLGNLVNQLALSEEGTFHRALFDAQMTAKLWLHMLAQIRATYGIERVPFALMQQIACTPKKQVAKILQQYSVQSATL